MPAQTRSRQTTSRRTPNSAPHQASKAQDADSNSVDEEASDDGDVVSDDHGDDGHNADLSSTLATPSLTSQPLRMSYTIGPGETGVLTFEPYKSLLLPLWRFRTVPVAEHSSVALSAAFSHYLAAGDFVGADMARKFLQMGMTRAGRYANYAGGRKYAASGEQKVRSEGHAGREEKLKVKEIFRKVWERAKADERYAVLREEWRQEKKTWEKGGRKERPDAIGT